MKNLNSIVPGGLCDAPLRRDLVTVADPPGLGESRQSVSTEDITFPVGFAHALSSVGVRFRETPAWLGSSTAPRSSGALAFVRIALSFVRPPYDSNMTCCAKKRKCMIYQHIFSGLLKFQESEIPTFFPPLLIRHTAEFFWGLGVSAAESMGAGKKSGGANGN